MYTKYFGLSEEPFRVTPDRRFLYLGDVHGPVISKLRSAVVRPHGLCLLTGAPGVGKTLALRQVISMLPEETPVSVLFNAHLDLRGFLDAVLTDFGVDLTPDASVDTLLEDLESFVGACRASGRRPVIMVDEAGNLSPEVVTRLGEVVNPGPDGSQGLALVLASDLAHRDALLASLGADVVIAEIAVEPLGRGEVMKYVEHRLRAAGWRDGAMFYDAALDRVVEVSGGVPRLINSLASKALLLTHLCGDQVVTRATIDEAARELWSLGTAPPAVPCGSAELGSGLQGEVFGERETPVPHAVVAGTPPAAGTGARGHQPEMRFDVPASKPEPSASSQQHRLQARRAPRARRHALLAAFAMAAALFTAKMSTESGQRDVIETAEPVIENVGRVASGLRELVEPAGPAASEQPMPLDWTPPPRPIPVLTRSARYVELQESSGSNTGEARGAGPSDNVGSVPETRPEAVPTVSRASDDAEALGPKQPSAKPDLGQRLLIRALMRRAAAHVKAGRYTEPAGDNAVQAFGEVLALEPEHEAAHRGMRSIALRLERQGRIAENDQDWDSATEFYRQALTIDTSSSALRAALERSLSFTTIRE